MCPPMRAHWRHLANTIEHGRAHWRHLANTIELVHPSANLSPKPKRQIDRFSRFCTHHGRKSLYFTMGAPIIHQNCPFPWEDLDPHLTHDSFGPCEPKTQTTSISSAVYAHMTAECLYTLQCFARFPLKIAPSHGGSGPPCNTWFLGPTRVLNPNGSLIASGVFARLTSVTDWQTHATRSVTIGRMYVYT